MLLFIFLTDGAIQQGEETVYNSKDNGDGISIPGYSSSLDLATKLQLLGWDQYREVFKHQDMQDDLGMREEQDDQLRDARDDEYDDLALGQLAKLVGLAETLMEHCKQQKVQQFLLQWIPAQVRKSKGESVGLELPCASHPKVSGQQL